MPKQAQKALGSVHPMFMGGNYLPETEDAEVEIARSALGGQTGKHLLGLSFTGFAHSRHRHIPLAER